MAAAPQLLAGGVFFPAAPLGTNLAYQPFWLYFQQRSNFVFDMHATEGDIYPAASLRHVRATRGFKDLTFTVACAQSARRKSRELFVCVLMHAQRTERTERERASP